MKKKIILLFMISFITLFVINVKADSGFDTSYDSGGWSSSGSSWSSSRSDHSSSWSTSNSKRSSKRSSSYSTKNYQTSKPCTTKKCKDTAKIIIIITSVLMLIIPSVSLIIFIYSLIKTFKKNRRTKDLESIPTSTYELYGKNDLSEEQIQKTIPRFNKEEFLNESYNIYLKVQEDWMNFNYDGLKENLTDELYNEYSMQLDNLKAQNRQNIMKDFKLLKQIITDVKEENGIYTVTTEMVVIFYDYIIENDILVRGSILYPVTINYRMTFIKNKNKVEKCQYCGAPLIENKYQICEYCRGKIYIVKDKWTLSKKESLNQR